MRELIIEALSKNQSVFGLDIEPDVRESLADYYGLVMEQNPRLHLTAPCPPEEFAVRHILESLRLIKHLPEHAAFVDVGSGGGLPAIPCLLVRDDLRCRLIESKEKKAEFLRHALSRLKLGDRAEVVARQFNETEAGDAAFVTCRALDKFGEHLPRLVKWSRGRSLLFFGGEQLGPGLKKLGITTVAELMPLSERRYLYALIT
ncbi:MAG: 16S rRNA (guanine(527)-N(7))-methyltransferase RsmG [Pyrinomonadaceae bacterium]